MKKISIKLRRGQNIFFSSDMHFDHSNIIRLCNRPWDSVSEMNQGLIDNWNELVDDNDIVFHLGDLFWHNSSANEEKLNQMKGTIYTIPGNHDLCSYDNDHVHNCPDVVCLTLSAEDWQARDWKYSTFEIWLCHYPMMTWPHRMNVCNFQLFGHIHSQIGKTTGFDQDLPLYSNQYDVGVDRNNWHPMSIDDLLIIFGHMNAG